MAGRVQQDAFIDDSDESCPLCVEEFDLSDKNFRPCPCSYQVCQFCYNNIKNHMNGLCPACRRPYDDQSIEWKIVSPEEQKADIALQARKKAMARKKETEQRQVETSNRKNLAGLRVVQKNLVYVVGLSQKSSEEEFLRTLRGPQYFGQYGKITKIVVSKAKEGHTGNNSIGVYVTFESKEDAAKCIAAVDGSQNLDRPLRAQYGTTKYCSAFLRNETCGNRNCTFLHETGEDNDSFSRQDLSSMNALSTQRPAQQPNSSKPVQQQQQSQPPTQQVLHTITVPSQSGTSKVAHGEAMSRSDSGDGSALPSSASWAAKNSQNESRISSKPASLAASSPVGTNATVNSQPSETRQGFVEPEKPQKPSEPLPEAPRIPNYQILPEPPNPLDEVMKRVMNANFKFTFDRSLYTAEQMKQIESCPPLFDPNGGLRRYRMEKAKELERQKQEEERNVLGAMSAAEDEEETPASGSLQLGGEPEPQDSPHDSSGRMSAQQRSAIQPPFASSSAFPFSGLGFQASSAASLDRTLTPQQQQHFSLLRSQGARQSPVNSNQFQQGYPGNTSLHHHQQSNPFQMQNQTQAFSTAQGHARQSSRFSFANDSASASTAVKPVANPQLMAQQAAMMPPNQNKQYQSQPVQQSTIHGNHFYSGVQGPPPGLKSSGTPPISGGGMFGQGHGFAMAMGGSGGFGNNVASKNSNEELMRELLRTRTGSTNGQGADISKREFKFPFAQQSMTSDAPASGLLSSMYGSQLGGHHGYQDHNLQKQKKKGKKHRHANTSSSGGGGIVDLADPSILQTRMHHGATGQGQFGTQGQEPSIVPRQQNIARLLPPPDLPAPVTVNKPAAKTTPAPTPVPPGLSLPQDFPPLVAPSAPPPAPPRSQRKAASGVTIKPVVPVLPTSSARSTIVAKEVQPEEENIIPEQPTTTPAAPNAETSKAVDLTEEAGTSITAAVASSKEPKHKTIPIPPKTVDKKQRPAKLDIAATKDASKKTAEPGIASVEGTKTATKGVDEDSSGIGLSQPATPETAASQASAPSDVRQRQPRTMKVPPLPKPEASSPGMAANLSKEASRRPSFTSIHRPETPTSEKISDTISYTSTSRANSPPPSKAGSVPVRQISKTQQKRERQARAKQAEQIDGSSKAEEPAARVEEVQAPVIGRKKKTRKEMTQGTADSTPTVTRPASPVHKEEFPEDVAAIAPMTPVKNSKKGVSRITAEVKEPDTPSSPATPASVEQQKVALTAAAIFHSMLDAGEINANAKDIFSSVPGLNHRFETLETDFAEDNDSLVSDDQHRLLVQGEAIQIERGPSNHVVMFPDRRALQGLSAAQASRYLELRKQALVYGDVPSHQALDGLIPAPPTVNVAAVSSIAQRGPKQTKLSNKFQTPAVPTETVGLHKYGSLPGYGDEGSTKRKPTMSLAEAERQLLASKKETEGLEKKLNALLKKNRRLLFGNAH